MTAIIGNLPGAGISLSDRFNDSTFSVYEVLAIGAGVLNWTHTVMRMGHASPASTLDYTTDPARLGIGALILRDFVAWTSGRTDLVDGCEDRLRELVTESGWGDAHLKSAIPADVP